MSDKVKFTRDGVTRNISKRELHTWNPEDHGWVRVEASNEAKAAQEKAAKEKEAAERKKQEDEAAKAKAAEAKAAEEKKAEAANATTPSADAAQEFSIEGKISKEFKTEKIEAIKAALTGKSSEEVEAFFAGEDRQSMLIAKMDLIAQIAN